jgi:hypothetical protein
VTVRENIRNPRQFQDALDGVLKEERAKSDDILFVYYSGHGVQLDGKAHLLGTGVAATAQVAEEVRANAQSAEGLLAEMERAIPGTRILVVEACRDAFSTGPRAPDGRSVRAGFAFQQDDVPNTFVMFANRPGLTTPARSDFGLMGPFTESLIYALHHSSGEILDVFDVAARKTREISPGLEPVMHRSKAVDPVYLRTIAQPVEAGRAKDLLNSAEEFYRDRAWDEFLAAVDRGKTLAADPELEQRLSRESEFGRLAREAEELEAGRKWADAAIRWQRAGEIFPARQWAALKGATAWLLAGDLPKAVRALSVLNAQSDNEASVQAGQLLADLVKAFPALEAEAAKAAQGVQKVTGAEFEIIKHEE